MSRTRVFCVLVKDITRTTIAPVSAATLVVQAVVWNEAAGAAAVDMSELPAGVADAIRRAIAFDRDERPASSLAFAAELKPTS